MSVMHEIPKLRIFTPKPQHTRLASSVAAKDRDSPLDARPKKGS